MLELPGRHGIWVIEIKRGLAPRMGKGFHNARKDIKPNKSFVVYAGAERYPVKEGVEAISLYDMVDELVEVRAVA